MPAPRKDKSTRRTRTDKPKSHAASSESPAKHPGPLSLVIPEVPPLTIPPPVVTPPGQAAPVGTSPSAAAKASFVEPPIATKPLKDVARHYKGITAPASSRGRPARSDKRPTTQKKTRQRSRPVVSIPTSRNTTRSRLSGLGGTPPFPHIHFFVS